MNIRQSRLSLAEIDVCSRMISWKRGTRCICCATACASPRMLCHAQENLSGRGKVVAASRTGGCPRRLRASARQAGHRRGRHRCEPPGRDARTPSRRRLTARRGPARRAAPPRARSRGSRGPRRSGKAARSQLPQPRRRTQRTARRRTSVSIRRPARGSPGTSRRVAGQSKRARASRAVVGRTGCSGALLALGRETRDDRRGEVPCRFPPRLPPP